MGKVNNPPHYNFCSAKTRHIVRGIFGSEYLDRECIELIEAKNLGFHLGNFAKYLWRAGSKGNFIEDLRKAKWYLDRWASVATLTDCQVKAAKQLDILIEQETDR